MNTKLKDRETRLMKALDGLILLIAAIALFFFLIIYFVITKTQNLNVEIKNLALALLTNMMPIPLVFIASYAAFRRIQTIRDERNRDQFVEILAKNLAEELSLREARQVLLESPPIERDRVIATSKELLMVGVALNKTVNRTFSILRNKLKEGHKIKILLIDPQGTSVSLVAKRKIDNIDPIAMRNYIELTLSTLCGLKQEYPDCLDIRIIDYPLSFGAIATDIESENGNIFLEYYSYKTEKDGLYIMLSQKDKPWYDYFNEQIKELWVSSDEWICQTISNKNNTPVI